MVESFLALENRSSETVEVASSATTKTANMMHSAVSLSLMVLLSGVALFY
jgi:hypothetical protein